MKKLLSVLLIACVLVTVFVACEGKTKPPSSSDSTSDSYSVSDILTESESVADTVHTDRLPDVTELRDRNQKSGMTLYVLSKSLYFINNEFSDVPYVTDEAAFEALEAVKTSLGISEVRWQNRQTLVGDEEAFVKYVKRVANGEHPEIHYDVIAGEAVDMIQLSQAGVLMPLNYYTDYIDPNNSWYPKKLTKDAAIGGNIYFVYGDIYCDYYDHLYGIAFDKARISETGISAEELWKKVFDGEWTVDEMMTLLGTYHVDSNKNGKTDAGDPCGIFIPNINIIYHGAGLKFYDVENDEDSYIDPVFISKDPVGENAKTLYTKLLDLVVYKETSTVGSRESAVASVVTVEQYLEKCSSEVNQAGIPVSNGFIPLPKLDLSQSDYLSAPFAEKSFMLWSVFAANKDLHREETSAAFIEYMGYNGQQIMFDSRIKSIFGQEYTANLDSVRSIELVRSGGRLEFHGILSNSGSRFGECVRNKSTWEQWTRMFAGESRTFLDETSAASKAYNAVKKQFKNPYLYPYE